MRRMIEIKPGTAEWGAWLAYHRGGKTELKMLVCERQARPFYAWTAMPPERASAANAPRKADAAAPDAIDRLKADRFHGGAHYDRDIDAIADREEARQARDQLDHEERAKRGKAAAKTESGRERSLRKVQMGDRPDVGKLPEQLGTVEIFDPGEEAELIAGKRKVDTLVKRTKVTSLRDDPVGLLARRDQVTPAQLAAARYWQAQHDAAAIGGAKGIDPTRMRVDGGTGAVDPNTDRRLHAVKELARIDARLGVEGATLIRRVLGQAMEIQQVAAITGDSTERGRKYIGRRLRECLDTIAETVGLAVEGPKRKPPRDVHSELAQAADLHPELHRAVQRARGG